LPKNEIKFFKNTRYYNTKMPHVRNPFNALDKFKDTVSAQLGGDGLSADWHQSEYCDQTFILMLYYNNTEIEFNLRFYPDHYAMSARFPEGTNDENVAGLTSIMKSKLDQCIYY
jgi:hypothetical protein